MKKIAVLAGIVFVMFCALAQAQTNLVNYQGELTDAEGKVLATGNYKIKFSIFTAVTGGTAVWTETHTTVPVANGHFNVVLGNSSGIEKAFVGKETYLEISVGDDAPIAPRQRILSVPYAINGCPAGTINAFAGPNVPAGWLACNGATVSKLQYPMLFEAIGTAWGGSGDSFKLPNLNGDGGYFLRGGSTVGTKQDDATRLPRNPFAIATVPDGSHTHSYVRSNDASGDGTIIATGKNSVETVSETNSGNKIGEGGVHTHTITIGGGDTETRPKNYSVKYIIKY
jgi:microcystin-dependent protein